MNHGVCAVITINMVNMKPRGMSIVRTIWIYLLFDCCVVCTAVREFCLQRTRAINLNPLTEGVAYKYSPSTTCVNNTNAPRAYEIPFLFL